MKQKQKVICVIMGGGRGSRLYPLTKNRCKPAVPFGGKYRLIDIPISNCLNSNYNRIYILTQFNTASLHRHIQETFKFDPFGGGFVDILSAEQTEKGDSWYQGTADAVRQNLCHFNFKDNDLFLILSGDQLYQMNFNDIIAHHKELNADVTISSLQIPKENASNFGIMRVGDKFDIKEFIEKPKEPQLINQLVISKNLCSELRNVCKLEHCLASMGIYVFSGAALKEALKLSGADFGKEIIPQLIGKLRLRAYVYDGYWEDIGTIGSFFRANLMLTDPLPKFNFFDISKRIFTRPYHLPPSKINSAILNNVIQAEGCIVSQTSLNRCIVGARSIIREGTQLNDVYMMGSDKYDCLDYDSKKILGIGKNCIISQAIIDKNARIGNNVILSPRGKENGYKQGAVSIHDGILVVERNGVVPDGTVI